MRPMRAVLAFLALLCVTDAVAATPSVGSGSSHSAALGTDGLVRTWGDDSSGQLGLGRPLYATSPARVAGATDIIAISVGATHVLALKRDRTVIAWGQN